MIFRRLLPVYFSILFGLQSLLNPVLAVEIDRFSTNQLSPSDYLFGANGKLGDPIFDNYRTIDLNVDIGISSDCGRIDLKNTLQASLKNVLDAKYFGDMGKDIIAASPLLLTCYFSPTWCAILKHGAPCKRCV